MVGYVIIAFGVFFLEDKKANWGCVCRDPGFWLPPKFRNRYVENVYYN